MSGGRRRDRAASLIEQEEEAARQAEAEAVRKVEEELREEICGSSDLIDRLAEKVAVRISSTVFNKE